MPCLAMENLISRQGIVINSNIVQCASPPIFILRMPRIASNPDVIVAPTDRSGGISLSVKNLIQIEIYFVVCVVIDRSKMMPYPICQD